MSTVPEAVVSPESLDVAGRRRTLTVVRHPQPNAGKVPVVLVLHGSMQTAAAIRSMTANTFDHIGVESGSVVAYLDGYKKHWNDARIRNTSAARADGVDDVAFVRAAIDLMVRSYGGDDSRVYAVGFSNGGQLVMRLIHETPSALAGAAVLSATQSVPEEFAPESPQERPVPVMFVHGTKDPITPYEGGMAKMFRISPRGMGLSAQDTAAYYARRNGITAAATTTALDTTAGAGPTRVERTDYRRPGHPPVTLYTVHEGGHTIPVPEKGRPAPATRLLMGRTDHTLDTARAISEFFGLTAHAEHA
ncbi:alpha/beta hydrolase family esterase [Streptomyces sp. NPDC057137]|uniref:alpha/beta hydrolase family esterase n=1 Tax=Streptomyces sp. NPDC057137 TaxID=3346030 RepID=UPI003631A424